MRTSKLSVWFDTHSKDDYIKCWDNVCRGQWEAIFIACGAGAVVDTLKNKKHIGCPQHAGKTQSNYRGLPTHKDGIFNVAAVGVCNTCGVKKGIHHLSWYLGHENLKKTRDFIKENMGWTWGYILGDYSLDEELTDEERQKLEAKRLYEQEKRKKEEETRLKVQAEKDKALTIFLNKLNTELFSTCIPLSDPAAEPAIKYFLKRGIKLSDLADLSKSIKFSTGFDVYVHNESFGSHMSIVSKVENIEGKLLYPHRIIIDENGDKVDLPCGSKIKGSAYPGRDNRGRGIKPFLAGACVGVSEGLEVALAAATTGLPVEAATDAISLEQWIAPPESVIVFILEDKDLPSKSYPKEGGHGRAAAQKLAKRLIKEKKVPIILSPQFDIPEGSKSVDWNDVYANFGLEGFPKILLNWKDLIDDLSEGSLSEAEILKKYDYSFSYFEGIED
ncbi:toprim domain-containing protein [Aliivibrio fischeri]|uniref:toprim domain-containing protein n=1 Tax=Aliivibrio fischeri TaxID=668 RepID=UPI0007C5358C|nr:toprim domain-containing protein [Aliivibrio fischeri]